ncbi:MAG: hypothetical protein JKX67_09815 [Colwellia sp.]|nr:hypothetical protein [Colwellia sp.]
MNVQNKSSHYLIIFLLWALSIFPSAAFGVTEQVRVSSNNDAEELISNGNMYRDSTDLEFAYDDYFGGLQIVGMRFKSVDIPKGATINFAYIEFVTDEIDSGKTSLVIVGEDDDSPKKFKNGKRNISKRTKTSASVNWTPSVWNSINERHQTPDISTIIQEIVDRTGWAANNNLVLIVEPGNGCTTNGCQRTAESHDGESGSAPLLVVDYTVGSSKLSVSTDNVIQQYDVSSYGGSSQDKSGTVGIRDAGLSLYLEGNRWQKIDFPYTVTTNTVIEFDFNSTVQGEIHGLGFDDNLTISQDKSFKVHGTQNWGISDFATYSGSGITHFTIPVGQFYTGNFQYLFFVNDDDSNQTGNSLYSNIVVYEQNLTGSLTGNLNVDNAFEAYISTDDSVQGTLLTSGTDWPTTYALASSLTAGQDYYLHIKATDYGFLAGFLGEFKIVDSDHTFFNGQTTLNTNTSDWSVSTTGWENYQSVTAYGVNGDSPWPWNRTMPDISATAQWIWSSNNPADNINYFSTRIVAPAICDAGTLNAVGIRIDGNGSNSQINTTTEALTIYDAWLAAGSPVSGLINGDRYNVAASGSSTVDRIDFGDREHDFSGTLPYPGVGAGVSGSDFLVHASGALSLPAGDYTIYVESDDGFSFIMDTLSGDTVLFNKFGSSTRVGVSNELRYENPTGNSNTGGSFTLSQDSVFDIAAIFFERSGGDFFEIFIANDIRTSAASATSDYEILGDGALNGKVKFGQCITPSQIDHFEITHDGQGLTCEGESVTIEACATSDCLTLSTEPVNLDFQADGATISSPTFTGSTRVNVNHIIVETLTLSVVNTTITPDNALVCVNTSGGSSCDLDFVEAGFVLEINGVNDVESCDLTKSLLIKAVKLSDNGVSCAPAFTGSQSLNFVFNYQNPSTGTKVPTLGITNMSATGVSQTRSVTFNGDGEATLAIQYHDAGELSFSVSELVSSGVTSATLSKEFYPTKLVVSTALTSTDSDGVITQVAGENFPISVIAQCQNGDPTPNYSPQSNSVLQLSVQQKEPITNTGTLTIGSVDVGATNLATTIWADANQTTVNFNGKYSEVGIINLAAQDTNYLGNLISSARYSTLGRFIPDHFDVNITSNAFADTCIIGTTDFTYIGQPFTYLNPPELLITAKNKSGATTKNYTERGYQKLIKTNIERTFLSRDSIKNGADNASKMVVLASTNVGGLEKDSAGALKYTFDEDDTFTYTKNANSRVTPFQVDYDIVIKTIQDSDSVNASAALDVSPSSDLVSPTGVYLRFGRWAVENTFGPETSDLPVPMAVQYYDGSNFITNTLDSCTNYHKDGLTLSNISLVPNGYDGSPATGVFSDGEINALYLNATGAGNQGKVKIIYTVPAWLQYHWTWNGVEAKVFGQNPTATATFGLFRGNDRIIYQREVH